MRAYDVRAHFKRVSIPRKRKRAECVHMTRAHIYPKFPILIKFPPNYTIRACVYDARAHFDRVSIPGKCARAERVHMTRARILSARQYRNAHFERVSILRGRTRAF